MSKETNKDHLPLFGVGPIYNYGVTGMTFIAALCRNLPCLASGKMGSEWGPLALVGAVVMGVSLYMWYLAVKECRIFQEIEANHLVTTGIYAWVRNPIYSSVMLFCMGALLIVGNWYLFLVLSVFFWLFLTLLMMQTEEKWLRERYGKPYEEYCQHVHRCIPWPSHFKGESKNN